MKLIGNPLTILKFERTVLNIISRMSGIATMTNRLVTSHCLITPLASTRKTLWGLLDKKAVSIGGGLTHRLSLSDEILIKDNHIELWAKKKKVSRLESLKVIMDKIRNNSVKNPFEIEVETEKEAILLANYYYEIYITAPLIIMLDNFKPSDALRTIKIIREQKKFQKLFLNSPVGLTKATLKTMTKLAPTSSLSVP